MDRAEVEAVLAAGGFPCASADARELVAASGGVDGLLAGLVARRLDGEPLEWLTGTVTFLENVIRIDRGVYVPRPQTEIIARRAIERLPPDGLAADLATGCGAVAVAMSTARTGAEVMATDVDPDACRCARGNGVTVFCGDLGAPLPAGRHGRFDVVVAVVPYVPTEEMEFLPRDVIRHEPARALDGGAGGLVFLSRAVQWGAMLLRRGGVLVLELGGEQDRALRPALADAGFELVDRILDDDGDLRGIEARAAATRPASGRG